MRENHLLINGSAGGDRPADLLAEPTVVLLPQPVHRDFYGAFRQAEAGNLFFVPRLIGA